MLEEIKERLYEKRIIIGITILILLIVIIGIIFFKKDNNQEEIKVVKTEKEIKKEEVKELCSVDIKGYINNPNLYEIECSKRINDVINLAGGLKENADTSVINLSKRVKDEMVIVIYSKDEVNNFTKTIEKENLIDTKCKNSKGVTNDACIKKEDRVETNVIIEESTPNDTKTKKYISINNATKEELMTLSGIGEAKALAIISYREENGPFTKIEDLMNITGIGEKMFAKIKDYITL